jgi:hypothetical protein
MSPASSGPKGHTGLASYYGGSWSHLGKTIDPASAVTPTRGRCTRCVTSDLEIGGGYAKQVEIVGGGSIGRRHWVTCH